jgi:TfoX/Sxy family transcriptional regulator of competence genes
MSYYEVPGDVIEDNQLIGEWADKALDVARRAAQKKAAQKSGSSKKFKK